MPPSLWLLRKPDAEPENHASSVHEASKKRLIEDTEDWHPRTGTGQSRSFRMLAQLTGTEHGVWQTVSWWRLNGLRRPISVSSAVDLI